MHEASITQSIMDSSLATVGEEHITGYVTAVHVTVGVCQGLVPDSMVMYFDMMKTGTPLENADLAVSVQKMAAHCPACDTGHDLEVPVMYCPDCGTPMSLTKGNEIIITAIEVEE